MTKKDYELIASALKTTRKFYSGSGYKQNYKDWAREIINMAIYDLEKTLKADNQLFDRDKFLKACGFFK